MKCTIPEIAWHNRDPVLSVDIQPCKNGFYRLASAGTDCHVLIWQLRVMENGAVHQEVVSDLTRHQRAVNVVRWSPSGEFLASGDDDANIIIWSLKTDNIPLLDNENERENKETWIINKVLRGHKEDVYDICWSPDGRKVLSGSIDNTSILWDIKTGKNELILRDHKGFVQGCCWDPKGQYLATLSSDRICRIYDSSGKQVKARISKGKLPVPESHELYDKEVKYFHDDTFKSYFRRLTFSPDGSILITPSGCIETDDCKKALHATYIFTLDSLTMPAIVLPSPKQCTLVVRCCPILFEIRPEGSSPVISLPYRMIIAVATDCDIILYDTQQIAPFSHLQNIHYTRLTDLAWSQDGLLLAASSTDGFCTLVTFELNELGIQYISEEDNETENILNISGCEEFELQESKSSQIKTPIIMDNIVKKPIGLDKWAIKTPKKLLVKHVSENKIEENSDRIESKNNDVIEIFDSPDKIEEHEKSENIKAIIPKRIVPTKVGDVAKKKINSLNSRTADAKPIAVRRKPKASNATQSTAKKTRSLTDFLKTTTSEKPICTKKTKTLNVSLSDQKNTGSCEIIEILEDDARDTWTVEYNTDSIISNNVSESCGIDSKCSFQDKTMTEIPEDFKLIVDDHSQVERNCTSNGKTISKLGEDINMEVDDLEKMSKFPDKNIIDPCKNLSEQEVVEEKRKDVPKTPRRVALITLSSPSHQKKRPE